MKQLTSDHANGNGEEFVVAALDENVSMDVPEKMRECVEPGACG